MFGAAVRPGGGASPTLARRAALAAELAARHPGAKIFLSGAIGRDPPAEAVVMARLLAGQVDSARLILDTSSRDTLQTVRAAVAFARRTGIDRCVACTDRYHQPRCRMLFRLFGMPSDPAVFETPHRPTRWRHRWRMRLREAAALPYDLVAGVAAVTRSRLRPR